MLGRCLCALETLITRASRSVAITADQYQCPRVCVACHPRPLCVPMPTVGHGAVEFYVKTVTQKIITLHITPDSTVVEAKQAITDLEGAP